MAVFDILVSHYNMTRWHEAGLVHHKADLAAVQAAKLACKQRLLLQSPQQPASTSQGDPQAVDQSTLGLMSGTTQPVNGAQPKHDPQAASRQSAAGAGQSGEFQAPHNAAQSVLVALAAAASSGALFSSRTPARQSHSCMASQKKSS